MIKYTCDICKEEIPYLPLKGSDTGLCKIATSGSEKKVQTSGGEITYAPVQYHEVDTVRDSCHSCKNKVDKFIESITKKSSSGQGITFGPKD